MRKCLCSLIDANFYNAFIAFITSLKYYNPWFEHDFVLFDNGLTRKQKNDIHKKYNNIILTPIEYNNYNKTNFGATLDRLKSTYFKLEMFSLYQYDRVVWIDLDTIVNSDISLLFNNITNPIAMVRCYRRIEDRMTREYNSGVIVLNKEAINPNIYKSLIRLTEHGFRSPDQRTINHYFRGRIFQLDKVFNYEKRMFHSERFKYDIKKVKIIHYVGCKPWEEKPNEEERRYEALEKIWWYWYNEGNKH